MRRLLRALLLLLTLAYFSFAVVVLVLRHAVLPQIEHYRPDIEKMLGSAIQRPVAIRQIDAYWIGLHPALTLHGVVIKDDKGRAALALDTVEAEMSWETLLSMKLRLRRFEIIGPSLVVRRAADGGFFVAGLAISPQAGGGSELSDWLLHQQRISIRDSTITWIDEQRQAPPLVLEQLNFMLENSGKRHRFGLNALPPKALASRLDLRGDFRGRKLDDLASWKGEAYAELDYADLAIWQQWVDYAVELPEGKGAVRLWLGVDKAQLESLTADVRLADLRLRLRPDLDEIDLQKMEGRLGGRRSDDVFIAELKQLSLTSRDGIVIKPTDFRLFWRDRQGRIPAFGTMTANGLDLDALARLARHLPLDDTLRARLAQYAPGGQVHNLALTWTGAADALEKWKVSGRFEQLRCSALGPIPGIEGLSGSVEGTERGGSLALHGQQAVLMLPEVFPQPRFEFDNFTADVGWKASPEDRHALEVELKKFSFSSNDAAGEASGRWHALPQGPGEIDMTARLTRGKGDAVWRYLPLTVGSAARTWLEHSITGGQIKEASMRLKGKLADYPYRGGKNGQFLVKGSFTGANLNYAEGWPTIDNVAGDLVFESEKMRINARNGQMLGVALKDVIAEMPDLESFDELLTIKGKALGATADFLRFIEASPVGERIDHVTEDMHAEGHGELDLKLTLPLRQIERSQVEGSYRFQGNRLIVDGDLPPLQDFNGQLKFTDSALEARGLRATLLGAPMTADIRTAGEGNVQVTANGEITVAGLRKEFPLPLFDHLSGATKWSGNVRIRKKAPEVVVTSNLVGLSSSLPAPFNKSSNDPVALRFERKPPPVAVADPRINAARGKTAPETPAPAPAATAATASDMVDVSLGKGIRLQLVRRQEAGATVIARGQLSIGANPTAAAGKLPERGMQMNISLPKVDVDFWRQLFASNNAVPPAPTLGDSHSILPSPLSFDIHADELDIFGKRFGDVRMIGNRTDTLTHFTLKSDELSGSFDWDSKGAGKLSGKIPQFTLPESSTSTAVAETQVEEVSNQMPALDINIGKVLIKDRELGSVALNAENVDGQWRGKFEVHNEDATLKGNALWRPAAKAAAGPVAETSLNFDINARNLEKLLNRLGYSETIRRGAAQLGGQVSWHGSPLAFEYPSLNGKFRVDAQNGQFHQLEPGVGRLLGILSLQSLPRRITLDFRDVFSQGFAFDRISADVAVNRGVMDSSNLEIRGPAARVLLSGSVNLSNETQNLTVKVQPALGESLAVGAMIFNPVAGAAAWVAQKLLSDPVGQVLSYDYAVSGSWSDPKVAALSRSNKIPPRVEAATQ